MCSQLMGSLDPIVSLREITADNFREIIALKVADEQKRFVESNVYSLAEAHFSPCAWFRAIYANETPVGFVMLEDDAEQKCYFLWRLMVDRQYQGRGYGRQAVAALVAYVKTRPGAKELPTSCIPGNEGPENFYRHLGFEPTGEWIDNELVMRLPLLT